VNNPAKGRILYMEDYRQNPPTVDDINMHLLFTVYPTLSVLVSVPGGIRISDTV
jgi:hypothetical protein